MNKRLNDSKRESSSNAKKDSNEEKLSLGNIKINIIGLENINIKPLDFKTNRNPFANSDIANNNNNMSTIIGSINPKINEINNLMEDAVDESKKFINYPIRREFSLNHNENNEDASSTIDGKNLVKENNNESSKKSDNKGLDFSFKNNFKNTKNSSNNKLQTVLLNNSNKDLNILSLDKTNLNANRKYKEDEISASKYSEFRKNCSKQSSGNPNPLPNLIDKDFILINHNSNRELNNLDVGKILNSKVYEDDKFYNVENINNLDLFKGTIHNSDNFLSMDKIENPLRVNLSEKRTIRNSSKSITSIKSAFTDLNEIKKNKIKLTLNSQNTIMTNQSGTNNTLAATNNITNFSVLEHEEIELKNFNRNEYGDSFCEAFFHAGLIPKKVKMIPDSESFIPPCKHKNCAILNAYRPEIVECFPGSVIDGIELNSTVNFLIFLNLFYFRLRACASHTD